MGQLRQRKRSKSIPINVDLLNILFTTVGIILLALTAILPDIFTVVLSTVMAAILSVGLPELLKNPAKSHATVSLWIVSFVTIILLLVDTGFLTISLCLAFGLLGCFMNEIARVNGRDNLIYSVSTNVLSMICIVCSIAWIIFTELYSWHFYVLPLATAVMVAMLFSGLLRLSKGFRKAKFKSLIITIVSFIVAFVVSWLIVKLAYKSGYQLYVTSAVLLDSSDAFILNYTIPFVYSAIIGFIAVGYSLIQKSIRNFEIEPQSLVSLISINLVPISLMSMPTYILLRIIGG